MRNRNDFAPCPVQGGDESLSGGHTTSRYIKAHYHAYLLHVTQHVLERLSVHKELYLNLGLVINANRNIVSNVFLDFVARFFRRWCVALHDRLQMTLSFVMPNLQAAEGLRYGAVVSIFILCTIHPC